VTADAPHGAGGPGPSSRLPSVQNRWRVAAILALLTGAYAAARVVHEPRWPTDFDQVWYAARALVNGGDPYAVVGPGRAFRWDWPLLYPPPAVLLTVPFVLLPVAAARVAFSAISAALLGWALAPRIRTLWPMLLSASYLIGTSRTQWAPLLLAAAWMPALGAVVAAKPNVGLASLAALSRRGAAVAIASSALITTLSAIVRPSSFADWIVATHSAPHLKIPILLPGGFLLLLSGLRWRHPEARMLLVLACTPHTPSLYDLLLLFFACLSLRETLLLAVLTQVLFWGFVIWGSGATFDAYALNLGRASIFVVYLPALVMILRRASVPPALVPTGVVPATGWRGYLPANRLDMGLLSVLVVAGTLLVWLPLATYR
jgi:hypothetical protein